MRVYIGNWKSHNNSALNTKNWTLLRHMLDRPLECSHLVGASGIMRSRLARKKVCQLVINPAHNRSTPSYVFLHFNEPSFVVDGHPPGQVVECSVSLAPMFGNLVPMFIKKTPLGVRMIENRTVITHN